MFFFFHRIRVSAYPLIGILCSTLIFLSGCGAQDPDAPKGPPIPDSPRAYQGTGTPIKFFGAQGQRFRPGADDPEYQEYLLWKEWKEYQRYREFLKSQGRTGDDSTQSDNEQ